MNQVKKKAGAPELLFNRAFSMGLHPEWITPNGLFVITTDAGERYINNAQSSLNSTVNAGLAKNKYYTRLILDRHNLPNIPYMLSATLKESQTFLAEHKIIIVKPLQGAECTDISIVDTEAQLSALDLSECILEKYLPGKEMRYLVLNGSIIAVHESKYGTSVAQDRYLERVSYEPSQWDPNLAKMSLQISKIMGLRFSAIDYLTDKDGNSYILEVNTTPGLKWFHAPSKGPEVDVAKLFLEAMINEENTSPTFA
jgi:glutathione synthase/RimK-type ligase-like ATP-grasp enzyme